MLLSLLQRDGQLLGRKWLGQESERSVAHALNRQFHRPHPGDHHHQRPGRPRLELLEQIGPFPIGQADVHDHQVEIVFGEQILRLGQGAGGCDVVALIPQLLFEALPDHQVVFQDDDFFYRHRLLDIASGSRWEALSCMAAWPRPRSAGLPACPAAGFPAGSRCALP